jgi:tripartite-type tricarboxylate transporter receptor subunit TctC
VVENIGGAGGALGAPRSRRRRPTATRCCSAAAGAGAHPIASSRPPFDPVRDFEPIALLVTTGLAIVVHPVAAGERRSPN